MWRWAQTPKIAWSPTPRPHCLLPRSFNRRRACRSRPALPTLPRATQRRRQPKKTPKPLWRTLEPNGPDSGAGRDSIVRGVRIDTDWSASLPLNFGAGRWDPAGRRSPFAATRSTRRNSAAATRSSPATALYGKPLWSHRDTVRFWESNGGAGPRATPTLANGRVHARRDRRAQPTGRPHRRRRLVAQCHRRRPRADSDVGLCRFTAGRG